MISFKLSLICHFSSTVHVRLAKDEKLVKASAAKDGRTLLLRMLGCRPPEAAFLEGSLLQFVSLLNANTISFLGISPKDTQNLHQDTFKGSPTY